jgi:hypothetical protein
MPENQVAKGETITEWCATESISKASFYALPLKLRPETYEIPGTRIKRVVESHESWRARVAASMQTKVARLEAERRRELAAVAGRIAAASPRHISKRGARSTPTSRRRRP